METLTLTTAQSVPTYQVQNLFLDWPGATIRVAIRDPLGNILKFDYHGTQATNMMTVLNKADLTSNSLHKRILNQLVTDGKLPAGTVTGSPD